MIGRVVSVKLKGTATVLVERTKKHPLYKKTYLQSKKYLVGTESVVKEGDIVNFINCKPISKNKHWKITKVLGRSLAEIAEENLKIHAEATIAEVMPEVKEEEKVAEEVKTEKTVEKKTEKVEKPKKKKVETLKMKEKK